jgi:hypothetical protein
LFGASCKENTAGVPAGTVIVVAAPVAGWIARSPTDAESGTVCGEPATLSATAREPVSEPVFFVFNVTVIVHVVFAAKLEPQVFDSVKAFAPDGMVIAAIFSVAAPVLVRSTFCVWVEPSKAGGKLRVTGLNDTAGMGGGGATTWMVSGAVSVVSPSVLTMLKLYVPPDVVELAEI